MIVRTIQSLFGTKNSRELSRMQKTVEAINSLEPEIKQLSDLELRQRTDAIRDRLQPLLMTNYPRLLH